MATPPSTFLRRATPADVATALSWTPGPAELRKWSGPKTRHPATAESLWADISNADATTFALELVENRQLAGIGQVRFREQRFGHLARIIVSPHLRGQGLGRTMCTSLMGEALKRHPIIEAFTLYVYTGNTNAIGLYESLGYQNRGPHPDYDDMFLMQAPLSAHR